MEKISSMKKCYAIINKHDDIVMFKSDGMLAIFSTFKAAKQKANDYLEMQTLFEFKYKIKKIFISEHEMI